MHVTLIFILFLLPSMTPHTPASHLKYTHLCQSHNPLQCSCLENPMGRGAWWAAVHGVVKSQTRLSDWATERLHFHAFEKEMATHSSVLAWRIPGMGEPGGLPSVGSHRVGHDWSDLETAAAAYHNCPQAIDPLPFLLQRFPFAASLEFPRTTAANDHRFIPSQVWRLEVHGGTMLTSESCREELLITSSSLRACQQPLVFLGL